MSPIPTLRGAGAAVCAGGLAFSAALLTGISSPTRAATADAMPGLEAPMQPIARLGSAASACPLCVGTDPQDGDGQRVAERSAPEYSAVRRTMMMPMSPEPAEGLALPLEPVGPDVVDTGSVLSLPGASITFPAVLR